VGQIAVANEFCKGHVIFVGISVQLASCLPFDSKNFAATPRISENVYTLAMKKY